MAFVFHFTFILLINILRFFSKTMLVSNVIWRRQTADEISMRLKYLYNDGVRGKARFCAQTLPCYHSFHQKFHLDWLGQYLLLLNVIFIAVLSSECTWLLTRYRSIHIFVIFQTAVKRYTGTASLVRIIVPFFVPRIK